MRYQNHVHLAGGHRDTKGIMWAWGVAQLETGKYCLCVPFGGIAYRGLVEFDTAEEAKQWFTLAQSAGVPIERSEERVPYKE